jgi:ABC-type antimicrobial peptide transport system permease subunit
MIFVFDEFKEGMIIAFAAIRANKMRSALTTLGIVIGIVSVTLMGTAIVHSIVVSKPLVPMFSMFRSGRGEAGAIGGKSEIEKIFAYNSPLRLRSIQTMHEQ